MPIVRGKREYENDRQALTQSFISNWWRLT